jgi:hypothetical protein
MLTGYSIPSGNSFTVHGTGAAFLTDVRLANGRPAQVTRLQWLSAGSPAITDYLDLRMSWAASQSIGAVLLLGLTCGAGVRVDVTGRRPEDAGYTFALGGNAATQRTVARSDGRVRHIVAPTATDALIGLQWRIYNDRSSSTWATAASVLDIGQAVGMGAVELEADQGWDDTLIDGSELQWTLASQPHVVARRDRRQRTVRLIPQELAIARATGLAGGTDWARLDAAMTGYSPVFSAVRWRDSNGDVDAAELHETGLFGIAAQRGGVRHLAGPWYDRALVFQEAPEA